MGHYNTFIVRIWSDGLGDLHGNIQHVGTHDHQTFADPEQILSFIRAHLHYSPGSSEDFDSEREMPRNGPVA